MSKKSKKKQDIKESRISLRLIVGISVGLLVGVALFLRIVLPYDDIFTAYGVKFSGNDAYYYMRLVDNMVHNFPYLMSVDPYLVYPGGQSILSYHFFARLLAGTSWLIGLGHPSQYLVDAVCAYVPAIMGALVVIPVYFIGRELAGKWAGLISAALIAVLPGEFLGRSILGHADHHVAEVLFSAVAMLFLVMAIKYARQKIGVKPIVYSLLAGLFLGIYELTWQGGSLFLFVVSLYFVVQFVIDHLRKRSVYYLCVVGVVFNLVAVAVFLPSIVGSSSMLFYLASMGGALLVPIALGGLSWLMVRVGMRAFYYPVALLGLGVVGLSMVYLVSPLLFKEVVGVFSFVFVPSGTQLTTIEMQPLLFPSGTFTLSLVWGNFGLAFFVAVISLVVLAWDAGKSGDAVMSLIVVWAVVILLMALGQRRFAYYFAVNVALLAGYLSWRAFNWCNLGGKRKVRSVITRDVNVAFASVAVFLVLFLPIIPSIISTAGQARYVPSNAWCESLDWLRLNSPEPFNGPDEYYRLSVENSDSAYGVLAWWDYGYWITRIAHRIPVVNPGQNPVVQSGVADFFTSQDEQVGNEIARSFGSRYIIIDLDTVTGKFWAIARYAGKDESDYFGVYYASNGSQLVPVQLYYPEYYKSLCVRLYNFDGKATASQNAVAISYEDRVDARGVPFRLITDALQFSSYGDAEGYVSSQKAGNWRIAGINPFVSPIPLDALEHYEAVYQSSGALVVSGDGTNTISVSQVKIFEYVE